MSSFHTFGKSCLGVYLAPHPDCVGLLSFPIVGAGSVSVSLQCEYNLHDIPLNSRSRRKLMRTSILPPESRVMSLAVLSLVEVFGRDGGMAYEVCLTAGCSDGISR